MRRRTTWSSSPRTPTSPDELLARGSPKDGLAAARQCCRLPPSSNSRNNLPVFGCANTRTRFRPRSPVEALRRERDSVAGILGEWSYDPKGALAMGAREARHVADIESGLWVPLDACRKRGHV